MAGMRWLRLWPDYIVNGTTFSELDAEQRGVWFSLLVMAGYSAVPGTICIGEGIAYSDVQLAGVLKLDPEILRRGIEYLTGPTIRKLIRNEDGTLTVANWLKYQTEYERQRPYRRGIQGRHTKKSDSEGYSTDTDIDTDVEKRNRKKRGSTFPAELKLEGKRADYAKGQGLSAGEASNEWAKFHDYHEARGTVFKDWDAAWRTWVRNALEFNKRRSGPRSPTQRDFPT